MTIRNLLAIFILIGPVLLRAQQQPPMQTQLTLVQAVEYALQHSPDLQSAVAETAKRQGNVTTARSGLLPQLDVAGDFDRSRLAHGYPGGTEPSVLRFAQTTYSASANLKMLAWDFQQTSLQLSASRQRLSASRVLTDRQRQEAIYQVAELYLQTLTYQDLLQADDATLKSLQSLLDRTNELVKAGRAVPVDAFKIQTQIAEIESDSATLEAGRQATLSSLAAAMGYEGRLPTLVYSAATAAAPPAMGDQPQLVKDALAERPDVKAAIFDTQSASNQEKAVRRSYWPRIDFQAAAIEYGGVNPVGFATLIGRMLPSLSLPNFATTSAANDWTVGLHIGMPLFDGGRRRGEIKAAAAQTDQARFAEQKTKLNVMREVQTSYADLESARARVKAMQDSVTQAQEILKNEQTKYEVGRSVINFVLEAEAGLRTSQSLLYQAQRSESIAALSLELATGSINTDSPGLHQ
jgi:multidrug efflux system outer membrane protein